MHTRRRLIYFLCTAFIFYSCSNNPVPEPQPEETTYDHYISSEFITEYDKTSLQLLTVLAGLSDLVTEVKYSIEVYRIKYNTTYNGSPIVASGLVVFPKDPNKAMPVMSAHHGTMFAHQDAPSLYSNGFSELDLVASAGYLTVIPDYFGFGETDNLLHPYYHKQNTVNAVVDMIKAGKEFAQERNFQLNKKLFLFGYSEGGYVTMATHQYLEQLNDPDLRLTASAAGAGGYNLIGIMDTLVRQPSYPSPNYIGYIIHGYNTTYGWNKPLSNYFNSPYDTLIPGLYDGSNGPSTINASLTTSIPALLDSLFLDSLLNQTPSDFLTELSTNSVYNWTPVNPIRMYHGSADEIVPYEDSQTTFSQLQLNGATNVDFVTIAGGTHSTAILDMVKDAIPWFKAFNF